MIHLRRTLLSLFSIILAKIAIASALLQAVRYYCPCVVTPLAVPSAGDKSEYRFGGFLQKGR
ncbi:MAG: hypothetical protein HEQ12_13290 [Aphanizomenon flos-aquae DEX188]|nr:MAG: hypothetical protein HEQ12_13290 [Aphanizomenon flos-aquae DEX188]